MTAGGSDGPVDVCIGSGGLLWEAFRLSSKASETLAALVWEWIPLWKN